MARPYVLALLAAVVMVMPMVAEARADSLEGLAVEALQERIRNNWVSIQGLAGTVDFLQLEKKVHAAKITKKEKAQKKRHDDELAELTSQLHSLSAEVDGRKKSEKSDKDAETNSASEKSKKVTRKTTTTKRTVSKSSHLRRKPMTIPKSFDLNEMEQINSLNGELMTWKKSYRSKWSRLNRDLKRFMSRVRTGMNELKRRLKLMQKAEAGFKRRERQMKTLLRTVRANLGDFVVSAQGLQEKGDELRVTVDNNRQTVTDLGNQLKSQSFKLKRLRKTLAELVKVDDTLRSRADEINSQFLDVKEDEKQIPELEDFIARHRERFEKEEQRRKAAIDKLNLELNGFQEECQNIKNSPFSTQVSGMFEKAEKEVEAKLKKQSVYLEASINSLKTQIAPQLEEALRKTLAGGDSNLDQVKFETLKKMKKDVEEQMKSYGQVEDQLKFDLDVVKNTAAETAKGWYKKFAVGPVRGLNCKCRPPAKKPEAATPDAPEMAEKWFPKKVDMRGVPLDDAGNAFDSQNTDPTKDQAYTGQKTGSVEVDAGKFLPLDKDSMPEEAASMADAAAYFGEAQANMAEVTGKTKGWAEPQMEELNEKVPPSASSAHRHVSAKHGGPRAHTASHHTKASPSLSGDIKSAFEDFESVLLKDLQVAESTTKEDPATIMEIGSLTCYCTYGPSGAEGGTDTADGSASPPALM